MTHDEIANSIGEIRRQSGSDQLAQAGLVVHPVQKPHPNQSGRIRSEVTLAAYEVYCHVYGKQEAMVTGSCRGGFSVGELIAFLYAKSFPKSEWRQRVDEAFTGLEHL